MPRRMARFAGLLSSCASFSGPVIAATSAAARSSGGRLVSSHACVAALFAPGPAAGGVVGEWMAGYTRYSE